MFLQNSTDLPPEGCGRPRPHGTAVSRFPGVSKTLMELDIELTQAVRGEAASLLGCRSSTLPMTSLTFRTRHPSPALSHREREKFSVA